MKGSSHRRFRSGVPGGIAVALLVVALSLVGFFVTKHAVDADRRGTARRQAETDAQQISGLLERAGTYAVGLGNALAGERVPNGRRFAALVGSTTTTVGLADAMWVERVSAPGRRAYERRIGAPITQLPGGEVAGPAAIYLPATFVVGLPFRPGADMSGLPALAAALENPASVFAGTATAEQRVAGQPGFFLVQEAQFGHGPGSQGFLALFVPAGWLSVSLNQPLGRAAISLEGSRLAGTLGTKAAASESFEALTRQWRVDVAEEPETALQAMLPRLALAWPLATALLVYLIGRGMLRRRRAEREVDDIFDLSLDLLCILGVDGYLKRVNPAFEHTLGYGSDELLARRLREFVHPEDREAVGESIDRLRTGHEVEPFEGRYVRADGAVRWLRWNVRSVPERGLIYGVAHDVTGTRALLQEQEALRRVATLVAKGGGAGELFEAVAAEVGQLLGADATRLLRYEQDGTASIVAAHGAADAEIGVSGRGSEQSDIWRDVAEHARAAPVDDSSDGSSPPADDLSPPGIAAAFAAPIVVSGRPWGMIVAAFKDAEEARADTEARMEQFTELVATAVANAESRSALAASRRRVVATADETRRRIERDLHDGAQQRLVHAIITLKLALRKLGDGSEAAAELVAGALETTESANEDLRELARGIHPAILSRGGLAPALETVAQRSPIPVALDLRTRERLPESTEVTAYFVISEALVNAAKHSMASTVRVIVERNGDGVRLSISDDGIGGADPGRGSGLVGLKDRVEAAGGTLTVQSPPGEGTDLTVELPVGTREPTGVPRP